MTPENNCALCCLVYVISAHFGLCCIPHGYVRGQMRRKQGLPEEPCNDYFTTCLLGVYAVNQEARQMKGSGPSRQGMA